MTTSTRSAGWPRSMSVRRHSSVTVRRWVAKAALSRSCQVTSRTGRLLIRPPKRLAKNSGIRSWRSGRIGVPPSCGTMALKTRKSGTLWTWTTSSR